MACTSCGSEEYINLGIFGNQEKRVCNSCGTHYDGPVLIQENKELYNNGKKREIKG